MVTDAQVSFDRSVSLSDAAVKFVDDTHSAMNAAVFAAATDRVAKAIHAGMPLVSAHTLCASVLANLLAVVVAQAAGMTESDGEAFDLELNRMVREALKKPPVPEWKEPE